MELFERIRRDRRQQQVPIRELARRHGVHRRAVRQALADATPPPRKIPVRGSPALGRYQEVIRSWLEADKSVPKKQRHTAKRVWERLRDEYGAEVGQSTVRTFVAGVRAESRTGIAVVTVPQTHLPGAEAEVDFGEFRGVIAGVVTKLFMFILRLSCSGKAVHVAYANQAQESFLDGFVTAFARLGGVPARIRLDNLNAAVIRVLLGRLRLENPRFVALRSHYGFDAFYCQPGIEGAHEKGGVEGEVGRFRRGHFAPVPTAGSLAELNEMIAAADAEEDARRIAFRAETVGEAFAVERPSLRPLPGRPFDAAQYLSCRVDTKARICVRQSYYSVPARLAGTRVTVRLAARTVEVLHGSRIVAAHVRSLRKGTEDLVLDHYLEVLVRKPGALPGATALGQARAAGVFTATHQRFWDAARKAFGDKTGTHALIGVLLLHRSLPAHAVLAGISACLELGLEQPDPAIVAVEARRHLDARRGEDTPAAELEAALAAVTPIRTRTVIHRPAPTLSGYDDLLLTPIGAPR